MSGMIAHDLSALSGKLRDWLLQEAFPVWWERGADRINGGFHEKISPDGGVPDLPRRARVQPRQIYSFALAAELGWGGPALQAAEHGLTFFRSWYGRPDGSFRTLVTSGGAVLDDTPVLYDQAFALLAFAYMRQHHPDLEKDAVRLRTWLKAERAAPGGGFLEAGPFPRQSNPNMHLFEAFLAWEELGGDREWAVLADGQAELALTRFIQPGNGALLEFFTEDWLPHPGPEGRLVEPGHQYEWAWLLLRWGRSRGRRDAIDAALTLIDIAERYGVDPQRGVAINTLDSDLSALDTCARLWPQTERIKAGCIAAKITGDTRYLEIARRGVEGLLLYLDVPLPGLWHDRLKPDGSVISEPSPASSLYHIVCAAAELDHTVLRAGRGASM